MPRIAVIFWLLVLISLVAFSNGIDKKLSAIERSKKYLVNSFEVKQCPKVTTMKNVDKNRLLGYWYAYATTPLHLPVYQRRCASYNVVNNPHFQTNILFTDYDRVTITYACTFNHWSDLYDVKLRILTRTRTPLTTTLDKAFAFLNSIAFPTKKLDFFQAEAYCFEWYQLKFNTKPRPGQFFAPHNFVWDH